MSVIFHTSSGAWPMEFFTSSDYEVLMVSYFDGQRASCVVSNLLYKLTPPESLGQCDSNIIGILPRWLHSKIAKFVPLR